MPGDLHLVPPMQTCCRKQANARPSRDSQAPNRIFIPEDRERKNILKRVWVLRFSVYLFNGLIDWFDCCAPSGEIVQRPSLFWWLNEIEDLKYWSDRKMRLSLWLHSSTHKQQKMLCTLITNVSFSIELASSVQIEMTLASARENGKHFYFKHGYLIVVCQISINNFDSEIRVL